MSETPFTGQRRVEDIVHRVIALDEQGELREVVDAFIELQNDVEAIATKYDGCSCPWNRDSAEEAEEALAKHRVDFREIVAERRAKVAERQAKAAR